MPRECRYDSPMGEAGARGRWLLIAVVVVPILLVGGCVAVLSLTGGGDGGLGEGDVTRGVIKTCQDDVRKDLRDPGSARFDQWRAWEVIEPRRGPEGMVFDRGAGDKLYSAAGLVNAKNGFGGYSGDQMFTCDAVVTASGKVHARAINASDVLSP